MKLTVREKTAILGLIVVLLVVFAARAIFPAAQSANENAERRRLQQATEIVPMRKTARLSNELAEKRNGKQTGFDGPFIWDGELDVSIMDAKLYKSGGEARKHIDLDPRYPDWGRRINKRVLVCKVKIENKNAVSQVESKAGHRWFNITGVCPRGRNLSDVSYFDGMPQEGSLDDGESVYFDLPQGKSRTYTLAFVVNKNAKLNHLCLESAIQSNVPRYVFELS